MEEASPAEVGFWDMAGVASTEDRSVVKGAMLRAQGRYIKETVDGRRPPMKTCWGERHAYRRANRVLTLPDPEEGITGDRGFAVAAIPA